MSGDVLSNAVVPASAKAYRFDDEMALNKSTVSCILSTTYVGIHISFKPSKVIWYLEYLLLFGI